MTVMEMPWDNMLFASLLAMLCGFALLATLHVLVLARVLPTSSFLRLQLTITGWTVVFVGFLGLTLPVFFLLGILIWGLALVLFAMAATRYRANRSNLMLWSLAVAAERKIPLPAASKAMAEDPMTSLGGHTNVLSELLENGTPVSRALAMTRHLKTDAAVTMVLVGEQFAAVSPALKDAAKCQSAQQPLWQALIGRMSYLFVVLMFLAMAFTFMMWKIVPSLEKIFEDFGVELPQVTQFLIAASSLATSDLGALFLFLLFGLAFLLAFYAILRYVGWLRFDLPGFSQFAMPWHRSTILRCLAVAAESNKPLDDALMILAERHPRSALRGRLRKAFQAVQGGQVWRDALVRFGLLRPVDAAVLAAAERAGNLSWALRETADNSLRRYLYRAQAVVQGVGIMLLILFGALGGIVAIGMMMPLIKLLQSLS